MLINFLNKLKYFDWIQKLKDIKVIRSDIIAGITLALVMIPQSMAYASIAGLPLEVGLYSAFIPTIMGALFGSSNQLSTGPITIMSLMTAATLEPIATSGVNGYIVYASMLAFIIGVFYLFLGFLKLGFFVDFLSHPVILGFTNAVALITIISQVKKIIGTQIENGNNYLETIQNTFFAIESAHLATFVIGISTIFILIILMKFFPKIPRILVVIIIFTSVSYFSGFENVGGLVVGNIPTGLPKFNIPLIDFDTINQLIISGIIIGLIGFTQTISSAKALETKTKQRTDANKELIGQGLANISSSLNGGYAVAGSFSRSAVNIRAGAKTPLSSIVTGFMVAITLLYLTPYLYHLPQATLGAIIIVSVSSLIKIKEIKEAYMIQRNDGIMAIVTFTLTLVFSPNIEIGIVIGILLSLILFIYQSMRPKIIEVSMYKDDILRSAEDFGLQISNDVSVFMFDGTLFFANSGFFERSILKLIEKKEEVKIVIFDMIWLTDIDSSGQKVLENLFLNLKEQGIKVFLSGLRVRVIRKFIRSDFLNRFGKRNIYVRVKDVIKYLDERYKGELDLIPLQEYTPNRKISLKMEKFILKKFEG